MTFSCMGYVGFSIYKHIKKKGKSNSTSITSISCLRFPFRSHFQYKYITIVTTSSLKQYSKTYLNRKSCKINLLTCVIEPFQADVLYENIDQILPNKLHGPMHYNIGVTCVLYENIDQILPNKLHGPMHYKIGVTWVFNGRVFFTYAIKQRYPCFIAE